MKRRTLGRSGPSISPIALGCMAMSGMYGAADDRESIATIHEALERGVNLLDTGDFYGMGANEMLIGKALEGRRREDVFLQVKFGAQRDPSGEWLGGDIRPNAVKTFLAYTLKRLNVDYIDLYQPARVDPSIPIEETLGAVNEMIQAGYVRYIGLSEVGAQTLRRAHASFPILALQIEYSLMSRGLEGEIHSTARELGIGITAYGLLSRGLLSGKAKTAMKPGDFRADLPRWTGDNEARNLAIAQRLRDLATDLRATPAQLAMAWVLSRGEDIIPLAGARTRAQLGDLLGALDLTLSPEQLRQIDETVPPSSVAGSRYDEHHMATLDSER